MAFLTNHHSIIYLYSLLFPTKKMPVNKLVVNGKLSPQSGKVLQMLQNKYGSEGTKTTIGIILIIATL